MIECSLENTLNKEIIMTHGDVLEIYFVLKNVDCAAVENTFFTCASQGLCVECVFSEYFGGFCLRLGSDITKLLKPQITSYDFTIELIDGNKYTVIQNASFIILKKRNALCEIDEEDDDGDTEEPYA